LNVREGNAMLNRKMVDNYGWVAVAAMFVMLVLVWMHLIPQKYYTPLFCVAAALFAVRIILRVMLARQEKSTPDRPGEGKGGASGS
jgi:hypothetical protein